MGALVDGFGGKINGDLIRASDWNGMLAAVDALAASLQQTIDTQVGQLQTTVAALDTRVAALEGQLADLAGIAATLRSRYCRLNLTAGAVLFAIGQRAQITAQVAAFTGTPLELGDAASRPWVDFVTSWGTLLPAPGFLSRSGAGGRTVSVQVDASGQATVLLQADHAVSFSEAEHAQMAAAMDTRIQAGAQEMSVAASILTGATPASVTVQPAFRAITQAYSGGATNTVQRYLDSYYVQAPGRVGGGRVFLPPTTWNDYLATVLAFVKPNADPVSPDSAMASGSIQVTFRDWVSHWIVDDFFADLTRPIDDYRAVLPGLIHTDLQLSVNQVLDEVDQRARAGGILGGQRELQAAMEAVRGLNATGGVPFFGDAVDAVVSGIAVQRAVSYGEAVTPGAAAGPNTARAVAGSSAKAAGEAQRVGSELTGRFQQALGDATRNLRDQISADQQVFRADLLREDGPIALAQKEARDVRGTLETVKGALDNKASVEFVTNFVRRIG